jgi:hypothetical protein
MLLIPNPPPENTVMIEHTSSEEGAGHQLTEPCREVAITQSVRSSPHPHSSQQSFIQSYHTTTLVRSQLLAYTLHVMNAGGTKRCSSFRSRYSHIPRGNAAIAQSAYGHAFLQGHIFVLIMIHAQDDLNSI